MWTKVKMDVTPVEIASNETVLTSECQLSESSFSSEESTAQSYFAVRSNYMNGDAAYSTKISLNPNWNSFDEIVGEEMSVDDSRFDDRQEDVTEDDYEASLMDTFASGRNEHDAVPENAQVVVKRKYRRSRVQARKEEEVEAAGLDYELLMAYRIVKHLMSDNNKLVNSYFMDEVNIRECKDYHKVIKHPMCLRKVLSQLLGGEYATITEVIRDVRLVLENCYRYYGRRHLVTKKGLKLEMMLEQRLALLPRDIREKTAIEATSSHLIGDDDGQRGTRRYSAVSLGETSVLSSAVWNENKIHAKESRRRQTVERRAEKEAAYQGVVDWEKGLFDEELMKTMWELPQIGQFLYLSQLALNIPEVPQYELERIFAMPRESTLLASIMTSLLCKTKLRSKIDHLPSMPYRIWEKWLRRKIDSFFKVYNSKDKNAAKVFELLGIEPDFFTVIGDKNPLETQHFHEIPFQHRIWLVKALCDFCLYNQRPVQDAMNENPLEDQRDYVLGTDRHDYTYLHFPQFCGPDLRIYKRPKLDRTPSLYRPPPVVPLPLPTPEAEKPQPNTEDNESLKDKESEEDNSKAAEAAVPPIRSARIRQKLANAASASEAKSKSTTPKKQSEEDPEVNDEQPASNSSKFELVVDSIESLRALIASFSEAKSKKVTKAALQNEAELVESLSCLLKELEPWETKLAQSARRARCRLKKQYDDYWRKFNRGVENTGEGTIWDSEPEEAEADAKSAEGSDSSSNGSDSEGSEATNPSTSSGHKAKKRKTEEIGEEVRQEMFEDSVCTRERLKNARKFLRKLKSSHKEDSKDASMPADKAKGDHTTSPWKTNYIDTTTLMAQGQYEWETRRQTLLSSFQRNDVAEHKDKVHASPRTIQISAVQKTPNPHSPNDKIKVSQKIGHLTAQQRSKNGVPCYAPSRMSTMTTTANSVPVAAASSPSLRMSASINSPQSSISKKSTLLVANVSSTAMTTSPESGDSPRLNPVSLLQVPLPPSLASSQQANHQVHRGKVPKRNSFPRTKQPLQITTQTKSSPLNRHSSQISTQLQNLIQLPSPKGPQGQTMNLKFQSAKQPDKSNISSVPSSRSQVQAARSVATPARIQQSTVETVQTATVTSENKADSSASAQQAPSVLLIPVMDQQGNKVYIRVIQNGKGNNAKGIQQPAGQTFKVISLSDKSPLPNSKVSATARGSAEPLPVQIISAGVLSETGNAKRCVVAASSSVSPDVGMQVSSQAALPSVSLSLHSKNSSAESSMSMLQMQPQSTANALHAAAIACQPVQTLSTGNKNSLLLSSAGSTNSVASKAPIPNSFTISSSPGKSLLSELPPLGSITSTKVINPMTQISSPPNSLLNKFSLSKLAPTSDDGAKKNDSSNILKGNAFQGISASIPTVSSVVPVASSSSGSLVNCSVAQPRATMPIVSSAKLQGPATQMVLVSNAAGSGINVARVLKSSDALACNAGTVESHRLEKDLVLSPSVMSVPGSYSLNSSLVAVTASSPQMATPPATTVVAPQLGVGILQTTVQRQSPVKNVIASFAPQSSMLVKVPQSSATDQFAQQLPILNTSSPNVVHAVLQSQTAPSAQSAIVTKIVPGATSVRPALGSALGQRPTQSVIVQQPQPYSLTTALVPGTPARAVLQTSCPQQLTGAPSCRDQANVPQIVCIAQQPVKDPSPTQRHDLSSPALGHAVGQSSTGPPVQNQRPVFFLSNNGQLVQLNLPPSQVNLILGKKREQ